MVQTTRPDKAKRGKIKVAPVIIEQHQEEKKIVHPLAHLVGIFEGEDWEDILKAIKRNRQEGIEDEIAE